MKEGHNIFFDEKVQDKYFTHFLGGSKSFLLLFVYEHAHLTADYRGRDHARSSPALSHADAGGVNRRLARGEERWKFLYVV